MRSNNVLYFVVGALVVVVAGMAYYIYDKERQPEGVELSIGKGGISVEKK
ncbi:hypothetical protein [Rhizobium sp. NRK18]|jgi:hypothetical protein|nr:hypothetical protein [Rhizobium sp. NRK18]MCQ2004806.1 hypothetical protein [Rhizobium sp. NRK18]